jgi:phosphopantothenoylcysteine decarboxylase/phosphopantothenate--cysteine ligase
LFMSAKTIILIISGGIAAVKIPELIRRLRDDGQSVIPVMTKAAHQFVTPLSVSALAEHRVYTDLFDLTDEAAMGHIQLSRSADIVLVAPGTANLVAKMANGFSDDLASTLLLATDTPVIIAPSMNVRMWEHPTTCRNLTQLRKDGVRVIGPNKGVMACGEFGYGRMAEVTEILRAVDEFFKVGPLQGKHALVTSGPTHEPIDPVRYIANRSSGAQGTAIAEALRDLGARVSFVTGPADVAPPSGVEIHRVQTAVEMLQAVQSILPIDVAVCAAAVADWRMARAHNQKMKKVTSGSLPNLEFAENPDILAYLSNGVHRPRLVVGFAAETEYVVKNATAKRLRKGCDWIVANDVSSDTGVMGGQKNTVTLIDDNGDEAWDEMSKEGVAKRLALRIAQDLK